MSNDVMDRIAVRKKNATAPNSTENWQDWPPEIDRGGYCPQMPTADC